MAWGPTPRPPRSVGFATARGLTALFNDLGPHRRLTRSDYRTLVTWQPTDDCPPSLFELRRGLADGEGRRAGWFDPALPARLN